MCIRDRDEIGRLAAIAAIRTFLNYFLERDLEAVEKRTLVEADRGRKARAADA